MKQLIDQIDKCLAHISDGWCSPQKAYALASAIVATRAETVVEIGIWAGRSFIPMALAMMYLRRGTVIGIDPWSTEASIRGMEGANLQWWQGVDHEAIHAKFMAAVEAFGVASVSKIIRARSDDVAIDFGQIDLLHIDGNHGDEASCNDVRRFSSIVSPGGLLFMDDIGWTSRATAIIERLGFRRLYVLDHGAMYVKVSDGSDALTEQRKLVMSACNDVGRRDESIWSFSCHDQPRAKSRSFELNAMMLAPHRQGDCQNGSIIRWRDGYLIAWRSTPVDASDIVLSALDANLYPTGWYKQIHLDHELATSGRDDPRLFMHAGKLHLSFHGITGRRADGGHATSHVLYAVLSDELDVQEIVYPHYLGRQGSEKNWVFWGDGEKLLALYYTSPWQILEVNGNSAIRIVNEPIDALPWTGGSPHGGTPPIRVGDQMYTWFHGRNESGPSKQYEIGCMEFDATFPYRLRRMTKSPLIVPKKSSAHIPVVVATGAVRRADDWLISYGENEDRVILQSWPHDTIDRALSAVYS